MRDIQQNTFLPVKDHKTFRFIESKPCGVKRVTQAQPEECQNKPESSISVDIFERPSLENNLMLLIQKAMKANK